MIYKYLAWDGEKMVSPDYITREGVAWWKENSIPTCSKIIRQFTGLHDKHGEEIYEGDIVFWDGSVVGEVNYQNAEYICGRGVNARALCIAPCDRIEIIGNIYENPDLLKEEK